MKAPFLLDSQVGCGHFLKAQSSRVVMCLLMFSEMVKAMEVHFLVDGKLIYGNFSCTEFFFVVFLCLRKMLISLFLCHYAMT